MLIEIARIFTFATRNRRDIVRRLMACCDSFKQISFPDALKMYCYYERQGLVVKKDGYLVIYHDCDN